MRGVFAVLALAGCGDNIRTCDTEVGVLPTEGPLIDPFAFDLPDCVEGGLIDISGRWFVADPDSTFAFFYPRYDYSCASGLAGADVDLDASDDATTFHVWSDGTRLFMRSRQTFVAADFELTTASAFCMQSDGRLAGAETRMYFDTLEEFRYTGERFGAKDELANGLELVGELGVRADGTRIGGLNLAVDDHFVFVAGFSGLDTFDISDPASPVLLGHVDGYFNDVKLVRGAGRLFAFVSDEGGNATSVFDVSDPSAPIAYAPLEYSHSVFVETHDGITRLYLANYSDRIPAYDVTIPATPTRIDDIVIPGAPAGVHDLYVDGDLVYANYTSQGTVALDVSAGFATPSELHRLPSTFSHASWAGVAGGRPIVLTGDEGMTKTADGAAFLRVLDGDPASPTFMTEIGRYQSRREVGIHNFQLVGDRVYIAYYQDGVRVVDLSDPTQPREVAHYNTWDPETAPGGGFEGALGIRVVDGLIYVADDVRGLLILRETL